MCTWLSARDITSQQYVHWFARVLLGTIVEHSFTINLVIQGYSIYKDGWVTVIVGEVLYCERKIENYNDPTLDLCGGSEKHYPQTEAPY